MTMMKHPARLAPLFVAWGVVLGFSAGFSTPAHAQGANPNCPPGSWFCADAEPQPASPPPSTGQALAPLPPPSQEPIEAAPPPPRYAPSQRPVVIYRQAPPVVYVQSDRPPVYRYRRRPAGIEDRNRWGLNLHLQGFAMGRGAADNAGMGGGGLGLRYRPVPYFALDGNLDFAGGRDYNGDRRGETALSLNGLVFVNPRSRAQVYFLAGFGGSWANVDTPGENRNYSYFGGQVGIGLEFRLATHFALNADIRGFIRDRTDDRTRTQPEFIDSNGRTTTTSGGGIGTVGMTIYF